VKIRNNECRLDTVAQASNSSFLRVGDQEDCNFKASPDKKFLRPHFNQYLGTVMAPLSSPAKWGSINKRITDQTGPGIKQDPLSKITKSKMGWGSWLKW
jgi:hypothetical protein